MNFVRHSPSQERQHRLSDPPMTEHVNRRQVLQLAAASAGLGLAGCVGGGGGDTPTPEPTPTPTERMETPTATPTRDEGTPTPDEETQTPDEETPTPTVGLSVRDTETEDGAVTIPEAAIDEAGWLVVHPEASGGGPNGKVTLAQRQLDAGRHTDISLTLDTLRKGDQTVFAMLHYEDPADGEFTFPGNGDPPVTTDGNPVIKPFTVTGVGSFSPALSVQDQESDGASVVVPEVTIDQPGWLVIHPEASGGGPNGKVTLAERRLEPGTYDSVALSLSESLSADQTLYAMLHYENPADGEFTFPGNGDPPVTKDGSPLVKPFAVTVAAQATVEMENTAFVPKRLSVEPGTTVEWVNRDGYAHDVQSAQFHDTAASWDHYSGDLEQGDTTTFTFDSAGVYEYYCTIHGRSTMCGAVLVGDVSLDQSLPCEESDDDGGY